MATRLLPLTFSFECGHSLPPTVGYLNLILECEELCMIVCCYFYHWKLMLSVSFTWGRCSSRYWLLRGIDSCLKVYLNCLSRKVNGSFFDFLKKKTVFFIACVYYWQGSDAPLIVYDVESHSADFCCKFENNKINLKSTHVWSDNPLRS